MPPSLPTRQFASGSPLTEQDWQDFFLKGYCVIRSLLSGHELLQTHRALENLLDTAGEAAINAGANFDGITWCNGAQFVLKTDADAKLEQLRRVCGCGSADPILLSSSRHPKLLNAFADILMSETFEQLICQFHPKLPGDDVTFKPHRDVEFRLNGDSNWVDVNGWGSYVVAVIAIDSAGANNGGLTLAPESHLNVELNTIKPACTHFQQEWRLNTVQPELAAGDAVLMHPYLVHWSEANTGATPRFSLLSGVSSPGANHNNYPGDCTNEILSVSK